MVGPSVQCVSPDNGKGPCIAPGSHSLILFLNKKEREVSLNGRVGARGQGDNNLQLLMCIATIKLSH